jgi:hypothetical protein
MTGLDLENASRKRESDRLRHMYTRTLQDDHYLVMVNSGNGGRAKIWASNGIPLEALLICLLLELTSQFTLITYLKK